MKSKNPTANRIRKTPTTINGVKKHSVINFDSQNFINEFM